MKLTAYDGEHLTARFSVSIGVKIENSMKTKIKNNMKKIIEVYHNKYFIAKFAFKQDKRASVALINKIYSMKNIQNLVFVH